MITGFEKTTHRLWGSFDGRTLAWVLSIFLVIPPLVARAGICVNDHECNDGKPCSQDFCDPGHASADPMTGCAHVPRLYWTDAPEGGLSRIQRTTMAGVDTPVTSNGFIRSRDLVLDASAGKVYFTHYGDIRRVNLDGSGMETLLYVAEFAYDLALDLNAGKMYFIDVNNALSQGTRILRTNLDGSDQEVVVGFGANQAHLDVDPTNGTVYWIEPDDTPQRIRRLVPGGGIEDIIVFTGYYRSFHGLAVNPAAGKVYWAENDFGPSPFQVKIRRADANGSNVEDLVAYDGMGGPADNGVQALALVPASGKMYWSAGYGVNASVSRANLDGSGIELLAADVESTLDDMAVDAGTGKIYWVDSNSRTFRRAEINGFASEVLLSDVLVTPLGLVADANAGKIYWTDFDWGRIRRSDADGSNIEDLVTAGLKKPAGMALDLASGKMYWANNGFGDPGSIQRANLDGSNVEDVVTSGVYQPHQIALDLNAGKIYWTDSPVLNNNTENPKQIARADLDGSNVEALVTIPSSGNLDLSALALDLQAGTMYWSEAARYGGPVGRIRRADLNGANIQDVVSAGSEAAQEVRGLVVDSIGGTIYWTDQGESAPTYPPPPPPVTPAIRSANLNGSNVTDVITGGFTAPFALCMTCCRQFGDVFPVTRSDGLTEVDVDDLLAVLAGFSDPSAYTGADLYPCGGNGIIDVDDILVEISAFAGTYACLDSCPP